jgi:hypothetical protein
MKYECRIDEMILTAENRLFGGGGILSQDYFVHYKSHGGSPGIEPGCSRFVPHMLDNV